MKEGVPQGSQREYLPAAGHDWLLPLYDSITTLLGLDRAREELLQQADLKAGQSVIDIGCGTGSLVITLKQRYPEIEVVGLDPDPKALTRARRKAHQAGVQPEFDQGFSNRLRYPAQSFDHVFSSFMFHHLKDQEKQATLLEVHRVLKPHGCFNLLDFIGSESADLRLLPRLFHQHVKDNTETRILSLAANAGFKQMKIVRRRPAMLGLSRIAYYQTSVQDA